MEKLSELRDKLREERPAPWERIPDIPLYMDQVVSYVSGQLIDFDNGEKLTSAMINNYIKEGLMPRAAGKKYSREHIAYITAICILKQVLPVRDMKPLLSGLLSKTPPEEFYADLNEILDASVKSAAESLPQAPDLGEITDAALKLAISAYCQQMVCKKLICMLREGEGKSEKRKSES